MNSSRKGVSLAELVVAVGVIGILSFLLPLLVRLFNNLAYLQQKSLMQKEVKSVLWQMSHEVANAAKVVFDAPTCLQPGSGNCLQIYRYDYERYRGDNRYEDPEMFTRKVTRDIPSAGLVEVDNFVQVFYEVIQETPGKDYNLNGKIDSKPYLMRATVWPYPPANGVDATTLFSKGVFRLNVPMPAGNGYIEKRETLFLGRIMKTAAGKPQTFLRAGSQIVQVTLKLRSSFDRQTEPPRIFSTMLTMTGKEAWHD